MEGNGPHRSKKGPRFVLFLLDTNEESIGIKNSGICNHAMLFRGNLNDNSSAALGEKRSLIIYVTLKRILFQFLETMFLPGAEKRIAKLIFIAWLFYLVSGNTMSSAHAINNSP